MDGDEDAKKDEVEDSLLETEDRIRKICLNLMNNYLVQAPKKNLLTNKEAPKKIVLRQSVVDRAFLKPNIVNSTPIPHHSGKKEFISDGPSSLSPIHHEGSKEVITINSSVTSRENKSPANDITFNQRPTRNKSIRSSKSSSKLENLVSQLWNKSKPVQTEDSEVVLHSKTLNTTSKTVQKSNTNSKRNLKNKSPIKNVTCDQDSIRNKSIRNLNNSSKVNNVVASMAVQTEDSEVISKSKTLNTTNKTVQTSKIKPKSSLKAQARGRFQGRKQPAEERAVQTGASLGGHANCGVTSDVSSFSDSSYIVNTYEKDAGVDPWVLSLAKNNVQQTDPGVPWRPPSGLYKSVIPTGTTFVQPADSMEEDLDDTFLPKAPKKKKVFINKKKKSTKRTSLKKSVPKKGNNKVNGSVVAKAGISKSSMRNNAVDEDKDSGEGTSSQSSLMNENSPGVCAKTAINTKNSRTTTVIKENNLNKSDTPRETIEANKSLHKSHSSTIRENDFGEDRLDFDIDEDDQRHHVKSSPRRRKKQSVQSTTVNDNTIPEKNIAEEALTNVQETLKGRKNSHKSRKREDSQENQKNSKADKSIKNVDGVIGNEVSELNATANQSCGRKPDNSKPKNSPLVEAMRAQKSTCGTCKTAVLSSSVNTSLHQSHSLTIHENNNKDVLDFETNEDDERHHVNSSPGKRKKQRAQSSTVDDNTVPEKNIAEESSTNVQETLKGRNKSRKTDNSQKKQKSKKKQKSIKNTDEVIGTEVSDSSASVTNSGGREHENSIPNGSPLLEQVTFIKPKGKPRRKKITLNIEDLVANQPSSSINGTIGGSICDESGLRRSTRARRLAPQKVAGYLLCSSEVELKRYKPKIKVTSFSQRLSSTDSLRSLSNVKQTRQVSIASAFSPVREECEPLEPMSALEEDQPSTNKKTNRVLSGRIERRDGGKKTKKNLFNSVQEIVNDKPPESWFDVLNIPEKDVIRTMKWHVAIPAFERCMPGVYTALVEGFASGYIKIEPGCKKPKQTVSRQFNFFVLQGRAEVGVQDKLNIVHQHEAFMVPPGGQYSIRNLDQDDLLLGFVRFKVPTAKD